MKANKIPSALMCVDSRRGFTLIELSVVLVIIGLVVGGILAGRDLIGAATVRAEIAQMERYGAAANAFKIKYAGLPGDIPNAVSLFPAANTYNGDGNGYVYPTPYIVGNLLAWGTLEHGQFFHQLAQAGLSEFQPDYSAGANTGLDVLPRDKLGGYFFIYANTMSGTSNMRVMNADGRHYFVNGVSANLTDANSIGGSRWPFHAHLAKMADDKSDDGRPLTGGVRLSCSDMVSNNPVFEGSAAFACRTGGGACAVASGGQAVYNVSADPRDCGLKFFAGF